MALVLLAACRPGAGTPLDARAVVAMLDGRFTAGRLAHQERWAPCGEEAPGALVVRTLCGAVPGAGSPSFRRLERLTTGAAAGLSGDSSAGAAHALALLDLRWREASPPALDRVVRSLERARRVTPGDAAVLNDLAVAHLAVAERDQQLAPMLRALEAVEEAIRADSTHPAALFNRALILDRLYLRASARRAWLGYLARERDPGWRREARSRMARGAGAQPTPDTSASHAQLAGFDPAAFAALAARDPETARSLAFSVLAEWGAAVAGADSVEAAAATGRIRGLAGAQDAFARDRSLSEAAALAGGTALSQEDRRALAEGFVRFEAGFQRFSEGAYSDALAPLEGAMDRFGAAGASMEGWAAYYLGASLISLARYEDGDRLFHRVLAGAGPRHPALASKAALALGVSQLRRGNYENATDWYRRAGPFLDRAREPEASGFGAFLQTEGLLLSGQTAAAQEAAYKGLLLLSPFRRSTRLKLHLEQVAGIARRAGLHRAALSVMGEVLEVAPGLGRPEGMALALCDRARDLSALGLHAAARADLDSAAAWAARMPTRAGYERMRGAVLLTRGEITRRSEPGAALPLIAEAVAVFRGFQTDPLLPAALYQGALAARAVNDRDRAHAWMQEALLATERQQKAFRSTGFRATFAETVEKVSDLAVSSSLDDGRPAEAFAYLERARLAAWPYSGAARAESPDRVGARLPDDMLVVAFALLEDRLAVWSISRGAWRSYQVRAPRDSVRALAARLSADLAAGAAVEDPGGPAARLYDLLIRPLRDELPFASRVVVVPDRELHAVPFPALWDREARRFAVEAHEYRTAASAGFLLAALPRSRSRRGGSAALVVGNPTLDDASTARLGRLPGAEREAGRVAAMYPGAELLVGSQASRERVLPLLPAATIVHFAGHAVFDGDRPERSYLALAAGSSGDGRLSAGEIGELRLSNTEVVILSACSTLNPRPSRAGGVAGLALSFLRAGAPGTVSTMWDVRDEDVADLLVAFHEERRKGRSSAEALRQAQLRALRSGDPVLRAPRTWGAFTYTGG